MGGCLLAGIRNHASFLMYEVKGQDGGTSCRQLWKDKAGLLSCLAALDGAGNSPWGQQSHPRASAAEGCHHQDGDTVRQQPVPTPQ